MEERIPQLEAPAIAAAQADADAAPADLVVSSGDDSSDEGEFEFPFVSRDSPAGTAAPADELFADGRIRPFYPVFGRSGVGGGCVHGYTARPAPAAEPRVRGRLGRLFLEESLARDSSASSTASTSSSAATEDDDGGLDGAAPESYCVWRPGGVASASASPAPRPPRKSGSTGSMARWRRISDLVVGRSHSDGKEKLVFFAAPTTNPHEATAAASIGSSQNSDKPRPRASGGRKPPHAAAAEVDAAHRMAYLANRGGGGTPRRTFLPYREELVGFFANVNGVSRSLHQHPF